MSDLERTCPSPVQAAARKSALFVSKETGSGGPAGYFFLQSRAPFLHCFLPWCVNSPIAQCLIPTAVAQRCRCLPRAAALSKKATPQHIPPPLPQIPSLPRAQRKHAKHFTQRFTAVLLLLFLNRGGKGSEVFINKSFRKTRLVIQSAAWSGYCAALTQSHGTPLPACCFHTTQQSKPRTHENGPKQRPATVTPNPVLSDRPGAHISLGMRFVGVSLLIPAGQL